MKETIENQQRMKTPSTLGAIAEIVDGRIGEFASNKERMSRGLSHSSQKSVSGVRKEKGDA